MTYQRSEYSGEEIKTNGYFYSLDTFKSTYQGETQLLPIARVYFFNKNGLIWQTNIPFKSINDLELYFRDENTDASRNNLGIFLVKGDEIKIQRWASSTGGIHPVFTYSVDIVNDTILYEPYTRSFYLFRNFEHKPSSENTFID
ncbi:MAG: hypothetical protein JXR03_18705 [Cyclobacteriaceae bacterium]